MKTQSDKTELIHKAAVKVRDYVLEDYRHQTLQKRVKYHIKNGAEVVQGFITSSGRFVDREEAAKIALESGQVRELQFSDRLLFTADLY